VARILAFRRAAFQEKSQWWIKPNDGKRSYEEQSKQEVALQTTSFNGRGSGTKH
jgi:hypothetical protein